MTLRRAGGDAAGATRSTCDGVRVGNRFCILPMEGWDGTRDGEPSELTRRRWRNFGISGAKLIWGGEAVAVRHDGRANPNQLLMTPATQPAIAALREDAGRRASRALRRERRRRSLRRPAADALGPLRAAGRLRSARAAGGVRESRARSPLSGRRARHPRTTSSIGWSTISSPRRGWRATPAFSSSTSRRATATSGTSCSARATRAGRYGGSLENRTRFMRRVIEAIRADGPRPAHRRAAVGVRHGAVPQASDGSAVGEDRTRASTRRRLGASTCVGFGVVESDDELDAALDEARAVLRMLEQPRRPVDLRDRRQPVLQPAHAAAGDVSAARRLRAAGGSAARRRAADSGDGAAEARVPADGVRRLGLQLPAGVAAARGAAQRARGAERFRRAWAASRCRIPTCRPTCSAARRCGAAPFCRTFSDCTTGPRLGLVSGCYPLDPFYAARPEAVTIREVRTRPTQRELSGTGYRRRFDENDHCARSRGHC